MLNFKEGLHESAFDLLQITDTENANFVAFLQNVQMQNGFVVLNIITNDSDANLLLVQAANSGYIINLELASSPIYERFFANINCICETERDLALLLKHLPINKAKIDDFKVLKGMVKFHENRAGNVRINCPKYEDISFAYVRGVIYKGIEMLSVIETLKKNLAQSGKKEIYESIIEEKYKLISVYNYSKTSLSEISDLYNALSPQHKEVITEIYEMVKNIAVQNKVPNSSVISLQALEMLALKAPVNFEDITHIFGFNKRYVHNAVCRKILNIFENKAVRLKRNFALETALDLILLNCSEKHGIEKNLIASKREIVAYINGNLKVDFLKGWKKEVFGNFAVAFIEGKSVISFKNQQIVLQ